MVVIPIVVARIALSIVSIPIVVGLIALWCLRIVAIAIVVLFSSLRIKLGHHFLVEVGSTSNCHEEAKGHEAHFFHLFKFYLFMQNLMHSAYKDKGNEFDLGFKIFVRLI